jgi:hypothetical protein
LSEVTLAVTNGGTINPATSEFSVEIPDGQSSVDIQLILINDTLVKPKDLSGRQI